MTIAQIVYDNELYFGLTDDEIHSKVRLILVKPECSFASGLRLRE
jgi:hypothetical protein